MRVAFKRGTTVFLKEWFLHLLVPVSRTRRLCGWLQSCKTSWQQQWPSLSHTDTGWVRVGTGVSGIKIIGSSHWRWWAHRKNKSLIKCDNTIMIYLLLHIKHKLGDIKWSHILNKKKTKQYKMASLQMIFLSCFYCFIQCPRILVMQLKINSRITY